MPRRRYGRPVNFGGLLFVLIVLALWYMGMIPGLPAAASVIPQLRELDRLLQPLSELTGLLTPSPAGPGLGEPLGQRTKTSGCVSANALPDPACTPGTIFPGVRPQDVCQPGYSSSVRNVSDALKQQVYAEYGIASHQPGQYEVDHLISLELGGSNDIANLWPEPAEPRPGFHEKDQVENYLHQQVCDGKMSLEQAQSLIAHNWYSVYQGMPK